MNNPEKFFHDIIKDIPDAKLGKMFGAICYTMPNRKTAAFYWENSIVVKLQNEDLIRAQALPGTKLFDPMGGKPMKEWIQIPFEFKNLWIEFAIISADGVRNIKKTEKKLPKSKTKLI